MASSLFSVQPALLHFPPPHNKQQQRCVLSIANLSDGCLQYKLRTVEVTRYNVRPRTGWIKQGESAEVNITLLPVVDPSVQLHSAKEKFQVEVKTSEVPTANTNFREQWDGNSNAAESVFLPCVFSESLGAQTPSVVRSSSRSRHRQTSSSPHHGPSSTEAGQTPQQQQQQFGSSKEKEAHLRKEVQGLTDSAKAVTAQAVAATKQTVQLRDNINNAVAAATTTTGTTVQGGAGGGSKASGGGAGGAQKQQQQQREGYPTVVAQSNPRGVYVSVVVFGMIWMFMLGQFLRMNNIVDNPTKWMWGQ